MLQESKETTRTRETPGCRRRFSDAVLELLVWYSPAGAVRGFQLSYDRDGRERAFAWHVDAGIARVADGEDDEPPVLEQFKERAAELDPGLVSLVIEKLEALPERKS